MGVRAGSRRTLKMHDHFFHNEWIAHQETNDLGSIETSFAAQNGTQLEFREVGASGASQHLQDTAETELHEQTEFAQAIQLLPENHSALQISDSRLLP
jgi:hypothetical protein